ncbi:hypothetical protein CAEBREN_26296 [Caenorhabditis brenneri]|uniref:Uncharacterized protein n=1 Tax=Caenorhabditis brenneri TaxID=135651 RepID=G0P4A4_CAEBE|nr:hypothetical protein CAEBREN_26296 [Caenorhabditis brenneri]
MPKIHGFLLLLLSFSIKTLCFDDPLDSDFNPCNLDDSTCMPLEDFDQNCTCILLPDEKLYNVTDDVYLFLTGYPIHMSYITQTPLAPLFRKKLSVRIPKSHYYDSTEPDQNIYRNLKIHEKMALFVVSTEKSADVLKYLIDNEFLRTEAIAKADNRWCLEGECNAFIYESGTVNRTIGKCALLVSSAVVQIFLKVSTPTLQIFSRSSNTGVARFSPFQVSMRSLVFPQYVRSIEISFFNFFQIQRLQCEHKCKVFYWGEREMCMKQCQLRLQFDLISVTSDLKRNFDFFVQSSAIQNFRMKYRKFL